MYYFTLILFFFSGFAGLIYEVVWTRIFGLIIGNTILGISSVLAAFFMGLAFGGWYFGNKADHNQRPLLLFAKLEFGVCLSALLIPLLRYPMESFFAFAHPHFAHQVFLFYLLKFLLAFIVMLPATFLMGGTLPVLSRLIIREKDRIGRGIGRLYGINTLGAVLGCFLTAFFFLKTCGIMTSITIAVMIDLFVAGAAWLTSRNYFMITKKEGEKPDAFVKIPEGGQLVFAAMALSGFIALAYEVLWSRVLVFILTNSTYAFSIMLSTFLFGIACGGFAGGRLVDRHRSPVRLLGLLEIGIGLAALIAVFILIKLPAIHHWLFFPAATTFWWQWNGIRFLESFLVMFPVTFLLGATFPVAVKSINSNNLCIPSSIGRLYFFNTLGGVLGSFLTAFLFISWFGTAATMALMVVLNMALGIYLIITKNRPRLLIYLTGLFAVIILTVVLTPKDLFISAYSVSEKNYPVISFREGIEGTITVHEGSEGAQRQKRIDVDGLNVAGTSFMLQTLQLLQGHLPAFIHPDAHKVMQIGFGTGQTSYAALLHPIDTFRLVEISQDVMRLAAEQFRELNHDITKDPRFSAIILDGKNHLKYTKEVYDIIMNDANYAVATASASLFTLDHFKNARRKLASDGIFSTWMTTDLHPDDFNIVLRTFQSVFPHAVLWLAPNCVNKQVVLMGSVEPLKINWAKMVQLFEVENIRQNLAAVNINSPYDLMTCLLLDEQGMAKISAGTAINTDNRPILEFSTRDIRARDLCAYQNLANMLTEPPNWQQYLIDFPTDAEVKEKTAEQLDRTYRAARQMQIGILYFYQGQTKRALETQLDGSRLIPESKIAAEFYQEMDQLTGMLSATVSRTSTDDENRLLLARHLLGLQRYDEAMNHLRRLVQRQPENTLVTYEYARCLLAQNKLDSAKIWLDKSLTLNTTFSGSWFLAGLIAQQQNRAEEALGMYQRVIKLDPRSHEAMARMGQIYLQRGEYEKAKAMLENSLQIVPFQPAVVGDLGDCYLFMNQASDAVTEYKKAMEMGLYTGNIVHNLGNALFSSRQYEAAIGWYQRALQMQDRNAEIYYNLGNAFAMAGRFEDAVTVFQQAILINTEQVDYFNNLALTLRKMGRMHDALEIFAQGLRLHPNSQLLKTNQQETISAIK